MDDRSPQNLSLPAELRGRIEELGAKRAVSRGEFFFRQGDEPIGVFLLASGIARLSLEDDSGKPMPVRVLGPGCILGLPSAICDSPFSLSAQAVEDAEVTFVPRENILRLMRTSPDLSMRLLEVLSQELREMSQLIAQRAPGRSRLNS